MKNLNEVNEDPSQLTLVLGASGKTGRRIVQRLEARGIPTRAGSRSGRPAFDWAKPEDWDAVLDGVRSVYISYAPDLAVPGATDSIQLFVNKAVSNGVTRLVLLSGRGEAEAQACEKIVQASGVEWTIVRSSWFMQNFSEGEFLQMVLSGTIALPAADVPEPFMDVNDLADVAVAALTESGHAYKTYEVTGPRLLTFSELAKEISDATSRDVEFVRIPADAFAQGIAESGIPENIAWLLNYLFDSVLDGRNAYLTDGVQRALGREPADFAAFAERIAARGVWQSGDSEVAA
ncbi:MAG: NAD(P)H-binding protein [Pseudomonadota bacterium]